MFNEAEVLHGVAVNVPELSMMGCPCHITHVEGMLCVASRGGRGRLDGLECTMEGMAGADEMCVVHVQCRSEG